RAWSRFALVILAFTATVAGWAPGAQRDDGGTPRVGVGCLLYRSSVSGRYETVPLVHTDVVLDVRGLVVAATVTQRYANNTNEPIEAVYGFPLPHDAAVYDMEIRVGNRVMRSVIRQRGAAKRAYDAGRSGG